MEVRGEGGREVSRVGGNAGRKASARCWGGLLSEVGGQLPNAHVRAKAFHGASQLAAAAAGGGCGACGGGGVRTCITASVYSRVA